MEEISNYDTDLVCLEEIDHFDDYFNPFMKERGFNGVFHKKGGWHWDGTCLFFRKSRFEMINYNVIKFKGTT